MLEAADAVQLILFHTGPPSRITGVPRSGRYTISADGTAAWRGEGCGLLECAADEMLLVHLPHPKTVVTPGAALARLISRRPVTTPDGHTLTPDGRQAVQAATALFAFESTSR
ncbi:hypothetical protein [Streptomyces sp. NPDC101150]|uniref:hypothetical protein n=1 Tax=Streptomyces sp. NPDC101150 TaxID=3366114 RepID=UPI003800DD2D